jgi:hypothetical protein
MAALGNVGLAFARRDPIINRSTLTLLVQPTGNGPIQPSAPFLATSGSVVNLNGRRGAQMDRDASADAGVWTFQDLSPGIYYATEAGVSRQWLIEVAADLSFTVTPVTSSFPRTTATGFMA